MGDRLPGMRQRIPGALAFVDVSRVQRHGNRVRLVGAGIEKLPVNEDRHRDERCFPVGSHLQNADGAGATGVFVFLYRIQPTVSLPPGSPDLWTWREDV